ncbi:hypothetical protein FQZ97_1108110 [compost metagenome]
MFHKSMALADDYFFSVACSMRHFGDGHLRDNQDFPIQRHSASRFRSVSGSDRCVCDEAAWCSSRDHIATDR